LALKSNKNEFAIEGVVGSRWELTKTPSKTFFSKIVCNSKSKSYI
jgi:hypothetical protein